LLPDQYFRDGTALPRRLNEFAILVVARQWNSAFEWHAHCASAIEAGLDVQVAQDLSNGKRPAAMKDDEALVYDAAMC